MVVTRDGERVTDIGIAEGKIVVLKDNISDSTHQEIDAHNFHIFPGVIDAHVHFNEPGRTEWEGIETGSSALAAGGGTTFFDMPLNAHPPTCDVESFELKLAAAKQKSLTDFAFWGGLVPENIEQLERLGECGVIGFKAFMSNSGIEDFSRADSSTLRKGMKRVANTGLLVAVHAESESLTSKLSEEKIKRGQTSIRDYLDSRPIEAELEAIRMAIDIAGDTRCALHVVHVSSAEGVSLITAAKKQGADVSCETCPHYLRLTDKDMEKLGAVAKCAPPLRSGNEVVELHRCVLEGQVTTIGSDHSPSPPDMKRDANFFKVWGGISGVQHILHLLLTELGTVGNAPLWHIANLVSDNVARRFKIPGKGRIQVGFDADLALLDLSVRTYVRAEDLFYRHKQSPYIGSSLTGKVVQTILRGRTVFNDGRIVSREHGRLIKHQR